MQLAIHSPFCRHPDQHIAFSSGRSMDSQLPTTSHCTTQARATTFRSSSKRGASSVQRPEPDLCAEVAPHLQCAQTDPRGDVQG